MKSSNNKFFSFLSFISIVILGILVLVNALLPAIGVNLSGTLVNLLLTVQQVFTLIVIGFFAYGFVCDKAIGWKVTYWVSLALFVAGIVLNWI